MAIEGAYTDAPMKEVSIGLSDIGAFMLALAECARVNTTSAPQMAIGPNGLALSVFVKGTSRELLNVQLDRLGWVPRHTDEKLVIYRHILKR